MILSSSLFSDLPVYICLECNSLVEQPRKRWWSRWFYCPKDHVLHVRGLGASREQSFWRALMKAFVISIFVFGLIVSTLAIAPDFPNARLRSATAPAAGLLVATFYLFWGLFLLWKSSIWAGRTGPVQKLASHAKGRSYGFLTAVGCELSIVAAMMFSK